MNGLPCSEATTHGRRGHCCAGDRSWMGDGHRVRGPASAAHLVLNPPFARAIPGHTAVEAR